ncbi:hypothetical protein [Solwaraspora sp. WMMD792]|uniref:hypothetical protein n=1 Tax=Solwaraspora sp. WMMD792 TaxID=3016099 RepID=UPI002415EBB7|nr:hypothetical protein [Solwaraspora sp. WMMD792]MDG4772423.1 hypothetical protein [Solwaraspora sp. WMMD792]
MTIDPRPATTLPNRQQQHPEIQPDGQPVTAGQSVASSAGSVYTAYARKLVVAAQQAVDTHTTSAYNGCCLGCGRPGPCADLAAAEATLARYHRLPFRRPGATLLDPARTTDAGQARFTWWRRSA